MTRRARTRFALGGVVLTALIGAFHGPALAQRPPLGPVGGKNVLILHAFEANMPINVMTGAGLRAELDAGGLGLKIQFYEYLDLARNPGPEHRQQMAALMRQRYAARRIDVIVTLYEEALDFVLKEGRTIFPDAPVLALYLPPGFALPRTDRRIIPHSVALDMTGTLRAALALVPGARRVYVVSDAYPGHKQYEAQARREFAAWDGRLEFRYLSDLSVEDMLAAVSSAPPGTIVVYIAVGRDVTGKTYVPRDVAQRLSQVSTAPVFGLYDTLLGYGVAGGSMVSFERVGRRAGRLALGLLADAGGLEQAPAALEVPHLAMFDGRQLRRFNLSADAVPPGAVVTDRAFTAWDFRYYIAAAVVFVMAETCLLGVLLTQRRRRARVEAAFRASQAVSSGILASLPGIMAVVDRSGTIILVNQAWSDSLVTAAPAAAAGVGADYLEACRSAGERDPLARDIAEGLAAVLAQQQRELHLEYHRVEAGAERWFSLTVFPLDRPEGGAVISRLDITARKQAELEGEHLRRDLAHLARVSAIGQLTASLAHEVNQPLTAIVTNARAGQRVLAGDAASLGEVREILADIAADANRASQVIQRIRRFLRKNELEPSPLDLREVVREVIALARRDTIMRRTAVSLELDPDLPAVEGDRVHLQQVLLNLIMNGLEAMEETAPEDRRLVIRVRRASGSEVRVDVQDAGVGIAADRLEQIFAPFVTTRAAGLGMGLAITRSIVEAHGGKIWAARNPGRGTTFWFTLRASAEGGARPAAAERAARA
jgi:signal transduction histidine kinase